MPGALYLGGIMTVTASLKGHSQLWDRTDLHTSFLAFKKADPT